MHGSFELRPSDIYNIHHSIEQRISQQNDVLLFRLVAKTVFSDDSTVEVHGIDDLLAYNEVKPVTSVGVHLEWDILLKFMDKDAPEKQKIIVSFLTTRKHRESMPLEGAANLPEEFRGGVGYIDFRIEHTARTWGADMESLLVKQISSLIIEESGSANMLMKHRGYISLFFFFAFLAASAIFAYNFTDKLLLAEAAEKLSSLHESLGVEDKINNLSRLLASQEIERKILRLSIYGICITAIARLFQILIWNSLDNRSPSFVLLTKESFKNMEVKKSKLKNKWRAFAASIVSGAIIGVLANYTYAMLTQ